jgi:type I restriction enzyme, R subunit
VSQFGFLEREWAAVFQAASRAEATVHSDPRAACFYARRALELAVSWAYKHDAALRLPYQDNLSALVHEPSFKQAVRSCRSPVSHLDWTGFREQVVFANRSAGLQR